MKQLVVLLGLSGLAACAASTSGFRGVTAVQIVVEGSTFNIYRKGNQAEAVRVNRQYAPRIGPLAGRAAVAIQQATGCRVTDMAGDAAVLVGRLSCGVAVTACRVDAVLKGRRGVQVPVVRECA